MKKIFYLVRLEYDENDVSYWRYDIDGLIAFCSRMKDCAGKITVQLCQEVGEEYSII